jgi:hypothetical protein
VAPRFDPLRRLVALGAIVAVVACASRALGQPSPGSLAWPFRDATGLPALLAADRARDDASAAIEVMVGYAARSAGPNELLGGVLLAVPFDQALSASQGRAAQGEGPAPAGAHDRGVETTAAEPCDEPPPARPANAQRTLPSRKDRSGRPILRARDLRAATSAAQRIARLGPDREALDDLANRARWSAVMPELRLRVTRLVDESESMAPTEYDASRTTARGATSLWLEARGTWKLDRAVFADEEIRVAKLHQELAREQERVRTRVVALLFEWQRAAFVLARDADDPASCWEAWLDLQQLAVEIDLLTGGWFDEWAGRDRTRRPTAECAAPEGRAED